MDENLREKIFISYGDFVVKSILNKSVEACDVFPQHWHTAFEVLQIYERELHIKFEDKHFTAVPGDIVIFDSNLVHGARSGEQGCIYRALQFEWNELLGNTPFEQRLLRDLLNGTYRFQTQIHDEKANQLFDSVVKTHDAKGFVQPIAEKGELCRFVAYLMQRYLNTSFLLPGTDARFSSLIDYLKQHFTEDLTTEQLAEQFSYSTSHLCRKFKKAFGLPITDYIHICRIEYAQHLIKEDKLELVEIAAKCGYNSYSYFVRKFRQFAVITPSEWRSRFVSKNHSNESH